MSDKYPVPSYAANIWLAGDQLWLSFPSPVEGARGHSISLPNNTKGLTVALDILRNREQNQKWLKIGNRGAPTKWQVENDRKYNTMLRAMSEAKKAETMSKGEAERFLEELGL